MLRRARQRLRPAAVALALVAVAGCTATGAAPEPATQAQPSPGGGSIARDIDLSGVHFDVGSKEFTEQVVLGKIMIHALGAAGADTTDHTGLSGSTLARNALQSGDIDMYWEYSGTGWSQFLQHDRPVPGDQEQFRATAAEDAARNGIQWLGPAKFGNQYAIARAGDAEGPVGQVDSLGELKSFAQQHPEEMTLCGASEFLDRELEGFQQAYDVRIPPEQVYQNAFALNFVNVAKGSPCNFAEVFTTDARLKTLGLKVLEDGKTQFSTELAALTVREETVRKHPELRKLMDGIGRALTEDAIIELNGMVDLQGKSPDEAAVHFLRSRGFL
ncbi:hypothetical protein GIY23_14190 [Allosaccharopolyspora coralli]|uniref:ABC-type glycine betaine transport system substrate-binding domain-containing protein n=1 Tax=Allosaccharopolyspora coralli TaxID=2665642 RepID=A0A5Q3Q9J1_9PSEU|nr:glycine betaine ABC transporter substrate-binding protein [Allosaccharopolyspora coralli]QGK70520.1 hypothetical protein GIY23_14190 [Allosaccharopolyspora coralli]